MSVIMGRYAAAATGVNCSQLIPSQGVESVANRLPGMGPVGCEFEFPCSIRIGTWYQQ